MNQCPDACKMQTSGLFSIWLQLFDGFCGKEGIDVHFMQIALSVGVFVEVGQRKNGFQLPADLFRKGVRELHAAVLRFQLFHLRRALQRGEGHFVDDVPLAL